MTLTFSIGIRVKECRQEGSGNSEDGNTFRRAFKTRESRQILAEECDVPYDFINGLWNIYVALTSQLYINPAEFGKYCKKILGIYFSRLNWYRMIPSVHKILVHGEELLEELLRVAPTIAPGQLSEEPLKLGGSDLATLTPRKLSLRKKVPGKTNGTTTQSKN